MLLLGAVFAGVVATFLLTALTGAPYVPSHAKEVRRAFNDLRPLTASDTVLDIGSGDGVVLHEALQAGAGKAVGYEINPFLVVFSKVRYKKEIRDALSVRLANFWQTPFPDDVTVVYTFGDSRDISKMYNRVAQEATRLEREIDFISYAFKISDKKESKQVGAHYLYRVAPLQQR